MKNVLRRALTLLIAASMPLSQLEGFAPAKFAPRAIPIIFQAEAIIPPSRESRMPDSFTSAGSAKQNRSTFSILHYLTHTDPLNANDIQLLKVLDLYWKDHLAYQADHNKQSLPKLEHYVVPDAARLQALDKMIVQKLPDSFDATEYWMQYGALVRVLTDDALETTAGPNVAPPATGAWWWNLTYIQKWAWLETPLVLAAGALLAWWHAGTAAISGDAWAHKKAVIDSGFIVSGFSSLIFWFPHATGGWYLFKRMSSYALGHAMVGFSLGCVIFLIRHDELINGISPHIIVYLMGAITLFAIGKAAVYHHKDNQVTAERIIALQKHEKARAPIQVKLNELNRLVQELEEIKTAMHRRFLSASDGSGPAYIEEAYTYATRRVNIGLYKGLDFNRSLDRMGESAEDYSPQAYENLDEQIDRDMARYGQEISQFRFFIQHAIDKTFSAQIDEFLGTLQTGLRTDNEDANIAYLEEHYGDIYGDPLGFIAGSKWSARYQNIQGSGRWSVLRRWLIAVPIISYVEIRDWFYLLIKDLVCQPGVVPRPSEDLLSTIFTIRSLVDNFVAAHFTEHGMFFGSNPTPRIPTPEKVKPLKRYFVVTSKRYAQPFARIVRNYRANNWSPLARGVMLRWTFMTAVVLKARDNHRAFNNPNLPLKFINKEPIFTRKRHVHREPLANWHTFPGLAQLPQRERNLIALVLNGFTTKEIALELRISEQVVKNYLTPLRRHLGIPPQANIYDWVAHHLPPSTTVTYPERGFFLVVPRNFHLEQELNAWMDLNDQPDPVASDEQHVRLRDLLKTIGAKVYEDRLGLEKAPDQIFTANAGMAVLRNGIPVFIPSRFVHEVRELEVPYFEDYFRRQGYEIVHLFDSNEHWEGEGDMLEHRGVLFGGWGFRSDPSAHEKVATFLGMKLVLLHLVNHLYYHLDTALAFLDENTAIYYPDAFEAEGRAALEAHMSGPGKHLIAVSKEDAEMFACNAIVFGRIVVMNMVSDDLTHQLESLGFTVWRTPLFQFKKSGGSAKCLVLNTPAFAVWVMEMLGIMHSQTVSDKLKQAA